MKKLIFMFLAVLLILPGCAEEAVVSEGPFICCLSADGKNLIEEPCRMTAESGTTAWVDEMCENLNSGAFVPVGEMPLLSGNTQITSAVNVSGIITVDIMKGYYDLSASSQVILRAGITKSFTQIDSINAVVLYVDGRPAKDPSGNELLAMRESTFVDENADGINNYRSSRMTLYFADETGTKLIPETRNAYYSVNTPVEQAVLNELIAGPMTEGHYRTLPPELNVLNVTIQDQICYVNFDESLENSVTDISPMIQIYSIVDSIAQVCGVENVAFSVNGSSSVRFKDSVDLDQIFTPDENYNADSGQ